TTMEEFERFVEREQPDLFLRYRARSQQIRVQFEDTIEQFGVHFSDKRVLDSGPGYGEAVDVAQDRGASTVEFIEVDLLFYTFNRLKGFARPHRFNHALGVTRKLRGRVFDFIWARGSLVPDQFAAAPWLLDRWIRDIDK